MKVAIIDLGTNTFNMAISEINADGTTQVLRREVRPVFLGENGIATIGEAPLQRAFSALQTYSQIITELKTDKVVAIGTAGLRTASNGQAFIEYVREELNINIQLIDGDREADLIYKGVRQVIPFEGENVLIMDIGGGSVEFIIANRDEKLWAKSFPIGVSVLFNNFQQNDPITASEIAAVEEFVKTQLTPLFEILKTVSAPILIGASGTFDVLADLIGQKIKGYPHCETIVITDFYKFFDEIIAYNYADRLSLGKIPEQRVKLIAVALVLIKTTLQNTATTKMISSAYSMKEGILWEQINL